MKKRGRIWASRRSTSGMITRLPGPTPVLLSLYAVVALTAHQLLQQGVLIMHTTAWYATVHPTLSDAIVLVRQHVWAHRRFSTSQKEVDMIQIPRIVFERFVDVICHAA